MAVVGIIVAALSAAFIGTALVIAGIGAAVAVLAVFFATNWSTIKSDAEAAWNAITAFLAAAWQKISAAFTDAWDAIRDFFKTVWNDIEEVSEIAIDLIVGLIVETLDTFDPKWRAQWQALADFFTNLWNTLKAFIQSIWTWMTAEFTTALAGINDVWNAVWGGISSFFIGIWNNVESALTTALNSLRSAITSFVSWAEGVFQPVQMRFNGIGGAVAGFLKTTINVGASVTGLKVNDAIITPGGDIIQSDPADYLIATKNPGAPRRRGRCGWPSDQYLHSRWQLPRRTGRHDDRQRARETNRSAAPR